MIDIVTTDRAPIPNGHYHQALVCGGIVYLSMQRPLIPESDDLPDDFEGQMNRLLANCEEILAAANSDLPHVLSFTIFRAEIDDDWAPADAILAQRCGSHKPARAMVPAGFFIAVRVWARRESQYNARRRANDVALRLPLKTRQFSITR